MRKVNHNKKWRRLMESAVTDDVKIVTICGRTYGQYVGWMREWTICDGHGDRTRQQVHRAQMAMVTGHTLAWKNVNRDAWRGMVCAARQIRAGLAFGLDYKLD